jgi:hypothetical protein
MATEQPTRDDLHLPWKAVETPKGWELQHERGGWLFELNDRPDRATETDQVFIEQQDALMCFIVRAGNAHHGLVDALEDILDYTGGADTALNDDYVVDRARAAIAKAKGL